MMKKCKIEFFCPRWGSEQLEWEDFFIRLKLAGYDGFEWAISRAVSPRELDKVFALASQYHLQVIAQHYDTYEADFYQHLDLYASWLDKMRDYPLVKINSQTGKDFFAFEDNKTLIDVATNFADEHDIAISHETHRNKFSFAAHITKEYLAAIPRLRLTLDASHWVCVAESYLYDQQETLDFATSRTEHIHARVGYPEGPQVSDPSILEWEEALGVHLKWWDQAVFKQQSSCSRSPITITTEFGPYPYMVKVPGGKEIADQWEINVWMMNLLKNRYQ